MDANEQTDHLVKEIERVIDRFRTEYDITIATAVGVLNCIAFDLMHEATERDEY